MGRTPLSKRGINLDRLTDKQRRFCISYSTCWNGRQAAVDAGYSETSASKTAYSLLQNPLVCKYIGKIQYEFKEKHDVEREEILQQLFYAVTREMNDFSDENGKLITDLSLLDERARSVIDGVEQTVSYDSEGNEIVKTKLKLTPKLGAIDMAMRYLGMFKEGKDNENVEEIDWDEFLEMEKLDNSKDEMREEMARLITQHPLAEKPVLIDKNGKQIHQKDTL